SSQRTAYQSRSRAEHGHFDAFQVRIRKKRFLRRGALPTKTAALADRQRFPEFCFNEPRQREVQIVAAEQKMTTYRGALEIDPIAITRDSDQCEVARAAAHVAHENRLSIEEILLRSGEIVCDPRIKRRGGFFEQREMLDPCSARRGNRQFASFFIKARRHRE